MEHITALRIEAHIVMKGGLSNTVCRKGEMRVAVSVDIKNVFNTLSWRRILEAIDEWEFPEYIRKIIESYRAGRTMTYVNTEDHKVHKSISAGVP